MAARRPRAVGRRRKTSYERNRRAYRTYSREQRGSRTPSRSSLEARPISEDKGRLRQLVISAVILISVITWKMTSPQTMEQFRVQLLQLINADTDFVSVFSEVGRAMGTDGSLREVFNDAYISVFGPQTGEDPTGERTEVESDAAQTDLPENTCMVQQVLGFDYAPPVEGAVNDAFGYREHPIDGGQKFHYGLDLEADEGTVIRCFADGTVAAVGESSALGKYVTVHHENGYSTLYAHCSRVTASSGQQVRLGDPIAEAGKTGQATGPHLHFELQNDTTYLNPVYYVSG